MIHCDLLKAIGIKFDDHLDNLDNIFNLDHLDCTDYLDCIDHLECIDHLDCVDPLEIDNNFGEPEELKRSVESVMTDISGSYI